MKTNTIAKTMGGVLILCLGLFCVAKMWTQHEINQNLGELDSSALQSAAESFGKRGNQFDCEQETFRRVDACTVAAMKSTDSDPEAGMIQCGTEALIFQKHCLVAATPGNSFCDRIPSNQSKWGSWAATKCQS